jgi:plastocyanin
MAFVKTIEAPGNAHEAKAGRLLIVDPLQIIRPFATRLTRPDWRLVARALASAWLVTAGWLSLIPMPAAAATSNVTYGSYFFSPKVVTINVGDTVAWSVGGGVHTVLGTGSDPICGGDVLPCSYTFPAPGSFPYICTEPGHASFGMTGLVIVATAPPPPPAMMTNLLMLTNGQFEFTVLTTPNRTNIVQATTNLTSPVNWVPLSTSRPSSNSFLFLDSNAPAFRIRIYRVVEPP